MACAIPVRPGKTTELLVRLALEAGVMVRTERLIEDLWAEEAVGMDRNPLQMKVSRLRRSLGDGSLLSGTRAGYVLNVEPGAVDALEVLRLAAEAARLRAGGDPAAALDRCSAALAMFHGDVLPDAGDGEWVVPHRVRLEEARLGLVEDQLVARLDLGGGGRGRRRARSARRSVPATRGAVGLADHCALPQRPPGRRVGRLPRVRQTLAEQLGLEPGPALRALEHQVLLQDPVLDGTRPSRPNHVTPSSQPPSGAHHRDDRAATPTWLPSADSPSNERLVTLVGPAGIGKTRLAVEVASIVERTDGACLVRLEGARNAATVLTALAEALDVAPRSDVAVIDHLRGSDLLLVLDNCEQVVDAAADFVTRLIAAAPWVRVLCTSQLPLGLDGESVYCLAPLSLADSVLLFAQRAATHRSSFVDHRRYGADRRVGVSIARRAPAGDRARRGPDADVVGRRDRPTTGGPLRPAARPDQPPTRPAARPRGGDLVEL